MNKKKWIVLSVVGLCLILLFAGLDNRLKVQKYQLDADVANPIRIALITDLHSCKYGEKQQELISAVIGQEPDLILLGGDIFDDKIGDTNTEYLLQGIADRYPCYYVTGNHEYWSGREKFDFKMAILEKYNVPVLDGKLVTLTINGTDINIAGVDDPDAYMLDEMKSFTGQLEEVKNLSYNGNYTILLSHRPEFFDLYTEYGFSLVLSGHAHGGQWRIPGLLNGLLAPDQGLFPKYAGGIYEQDNTTMVVSRGLARESTSVPRVFNRPELVIVELR